MEQLIFPIFIISPEFKINAELYIKGLYIKGLHIKGLYKKELDKEDE